jgi:putative transposase
VPLLENRQRLHRAGLAVANPYVESFGSRIRDELLSVERFSCLAEAKVMVEDWREDYNERRPHSAVSMMAPAKFARAWAQAAQEGNVIPFTDPREGPQIDREELPFNAAA